jgi:hypothetical protein
VERWELIGWYADEMDDAMAQMLMALLIENHGFARGNSEIAVNYLRRAAEQGLTRAITRLAVHYWEGNGVEQDFEQAVALRRIASELGCNVARFDLANNLQARGTPEDQVEAASLFRLVAIETERANVQAQMGMLYRDGRGVEQDLEEALYWFRLAADQGFAWAIGQVEAIEAQLED